MREAAMGNRRGKTPRVSEKNHQLIDSWFPGSGAPPDSQISFPWQNAAPKGSVFSEVSSDQIRNEITVQERRLAHLRQTFPRVMTGTLWELNVEEEQAANKMEVHQRLIDSL